MKELRTPRKQEDLWTYPDEDIVEYDDYLELHLWKNDKGEKMLDVLDITYDNYPRHERGKWLIAQYRLTEIT
jgi:hypothetical protein